uniref:Ribosomal protein S11 n=1 Tax=Heterosigma akashiwo TaxID=2829 RepID=A0A2Z5W6D4_HETAK|nr:ribosomal protein S11 [Heterosigma akashiwo]BBB45907.1 ribosomal protein S11 [Heterosigma akashiwo]BBE28181.1 ribosomal protein S11 [Heterosigma akashiwo]
MQKKFDLKSKIQKLPSKPSKIQQEGIIYGQFSKQNTIFTLTTLAGQVKTSVSNGMVGYKNSKSKTQFATQAAAERLGQKAKALNFGSITFVIKGKNKGRKKCVKTFQKAGLKINMIYDQTPIIHNGCRPPKEPRR